MSEVDNLRSELAKAQALESHLTEDNAHLRETLATVRAESDQRVQAEAERWERYVDNAERRRDEAHAKAQRLQGDLRAANTVRDMLWQEMAGLITEAGKEIRDEDGKFYGFERGGGRDTHRTVGEHRARSIDTQEWCYPSLPCSMCCPPVDASALREVLDRHS